ncbi:MAG: 3-phenylpropionate/trans-cinnamate dioxygenase ferredoxin reductase component [Nocardioidaceae bacterium]|nr:3-phenylpropionate/trans-cinnamate dioxygenase ferredoxin reductase component [Nocardioidaceae bacterium]
MSNVASRVDTIAVVGGGLAAARACETLRDEGFDGRLVLVSAEQHPPYERPPLSKGYLLGHDPLEKAFVHGSTWYSDHHVDLRLSTSAEGLDLERHTLTTANGDEVWFDRLLLATGAGPRHLPQADASSGPVTYLRTIEDSDRLKVALKPGQRLVVIGGGWIGLEVAAAGRILGAEVTVVEPMAQPLLRVLGSEVGELFADLHREHGVDLRLSTSVETIEANGETAVVRLSDGWTVTADLVLVAIGAVPRTTLAEVAGLSIDNGVVVDQRLRTSHPDVYAAGDVANAFHPGLGRHVRVEHWDNAIHQGRTAARNLLGAEETYERVPYFFTDQYDLGMEYVGAVGPEGYDDVEVRGDLDRRVFTAYWRKGGRVVAGMHANDWDAIDEVRRAVSG